jgi:hypothetical protein
MTIIRIGCDPEGFLVDGKGEFVPALHYVKGTKANPHKLDGGAVQVDGLACEFNIDPVETADAFVGNIKKVLYQINEMVHQVDKDVSLRWTPVASFRKTIWDMTPQANKELGCDPDYNVSGQVNVNPSEKLEGQAFRTAAGHIHIGWLEELIESPTEVGHFSTCLDIANGFFHGHLSSFIPETEDEEKRLSYYGSHGAWRPKRYGIELRAPSNRWVRSEDSQRQIFSQVRTRFSDLTGL